MFRQKSKKTKLNIIKSNDSNIIEFNEEANATLNIVGVNNIIKCSTKLNNVRIEVFGDNNIITINAKSIYNSRICIGSFEQNEPANNCKLNIDEDTTIGDNLELRLFDNDSIVQVGKDCMISANVSIWAGDSHAVLDLNGNCINKASDIIIGNHCWIGKDCVILKNSKIADNSILAWRSTLTKRYNDKNILLAGLSATIKKREINWSRSTVNSVLSKSK